MLIPPGMFTKESSKFAEPGTRAGFQFAGVAQSVGELGSVPSQVNETASNFHPLLIMAAMSGEAGELFVTTNAPAISVPESF